MRWLWIGAAVLAVFLICFGGNPMVLFVLLRLYGEWLGIILLVLIGLYFLFRKRRS